MNEGQLDTLTEAVRTTGSIVASVEASEPINFKEFSQSQMLVGKLYCYNQAYENDEHIDVVPPNATADEMITEARDILDYDDFYDNDHEEGLLKETHGLLCEALALVSPVAAQGA